MTNAQYLDRRVWNIPLRELLLFIGIYFFFALTYFITLVVNSGALYFYYLSVPLDYLLKFLSIIPFWWLYFRKLKDWTFSRKLMLHLVTLPIYVFLWINLYYASCELLGLNHLRGVGRVWDLYIPSLLYFIQFGILHVYDYYKKLQKEREHAAELRQIALQSELSALKAQINPHFLYNVFNTISASVPAAQEETRIMIAQLSDLFRYQLKASKVERVTIAEEIDFIKKYLDLEKARFGERMLYEIEVSPEILQERIPPLLIQPLIENAIKHGIAPSVAGGKIWVHIHQAGEKVEIIVKDSGKGIQNHNVNDLLDQGVGLSNTHRRLLRRYGQGVHLEKNLPSGLSVQFSIPL
ncbi:MAG: histidine kinase [Saprospiraceae bacterium]|nr:histidine kinase [Saprospiraceae bacterium]